VSVPANLNVNVTMLEQNWAFGKIAGKPRQIAFGEEF
jgi:hypothetical protein